MQTKVSRTLSRIARRLSSGVGRGGLTYRDPPRRGQAGQASPAEP